MVRSGCEPEPRDLARHDRVKMVPTEIDHIAHHKFVQSVIIGIFMMIKEDLHRQHARKAAQTNKLGSFNQGNTHAAQNMAPASSGPPGFCVFCGLSDMLVL